MPRAHYMTIVREPVARWISAVGFYDSRNLYESGCDINAYVARVGYRGGPNSRRNSSIALSRGMDGPSAVRAVAGLKHNYPLAERGLYSVAHLCVRPSPTHTHAAGTQMPNAMSFELDLLELIDPPSSALGGSATRRLDKYLDKRTYRLSEAAMARLLTSWDVLVLERLDATLDALRRKYNLRIDDVTTYDMKAGGLTYAAAATRRRQRPSRLHSSASHALRFLLLHPRDGEQEVRDGRGAGTVPHLQDQEHAPERRGASRHPRRQRARRGDVRACACADAVGAGRTPHRRASNPRALLALLSVADAAVAAASSSRCVRALRPDRTPTLGGSATPRGRRSLRGAERRRKRRRRDRS